MPFDTAIPMTMSTPISAVIENPCPAAMSATTMPTSAQGMVKSMMNGSRSDLKLRRRDHRNDHHRERERDAETREHVAA